MKIEQTSSSCELEHECGAAGSMIDCIALRCVDAVLMLYCDCDCIDDRTRTATHHYTQQST